MQKRQLQRDQYFQEQSRTTSNYVIPFINEVKKVSGNSRVLEIGCGEGGNIKPFLDLGCECVGIDLSTLKIDLAVEFFSNHSNRSNLRLMLEDIYDVPEEEIGKFDIIIMRDVIEHIHNQDRFMAHMKQYLKKDGIVFLGFPPWQMPFGGHQQSLKNKYLSKVPYTHLLPRSLYTSLLRLGNESEAMIEGRLEIVDTGISIERFRKVAHDNGYKTNKERLYFLNPNYEAKFGLKPMKQTKLLTAIPHLRNYFVTCMYTIISQDYNPH